MTPREPTARWRNFVDFVKHRPALLALAGPLSRGVGRWRFVDRLTCRPPASAAPDLSRWPDATLAACWLGHATVLLKMGDLTILTDPVFSRRIGLGGGFFTIGPGRLAMPALAIGALPPIDVVLLSHAHFDHLDRPGLWTLAKRFPRATLIAARGLTDLTRDLRFADRRELAIGASTAIGPLTVSAIPVNHWSARMVSDTHREACAFLLESAGRRVLFGADSAHSELWKPIGEAGGVDLGIVGIGGYDPWIQGHASPEQAWEMAVAHAGARRVLPMHHSTFKLSLEPTRDPIDRFLRAAREGADRVLDPALGAVWIGQQRDAPATR